MLPKPQRKDVKIINGKRVWNSGDPTPLCMCGCGNPVKFNSKHFPRRYVIGHSARQNIQPSWRDDLDKSVPIDSLRSAVFAWIQKHNMTTLEFATMCGLSQNQFNSLMYDKRRKTTTMKIVNHFALRCAGRATPLTTYEYEQLKDERKRQTQIGASFQRYGI